MRTRARNPRGAIRTAAILAACGGLTIAACRGTDPTQVELVIPAAGPAPILAASRTFDDALLTGVLTLTPQPTTTGWSYEVDLNEDSAPDHSGTLVGPVDFTYSFEDPGLHWLGIRLHGPEEPLDVAIPVAVNDPSAISILAGARLPAATSSFTGITTAPDGTVYALHYGDEPWMEFSGRLFEVDPLSLDVRRELAIGSGALNVAVSPSDSLIFITGDDDDFNLVHRKSWALVWHEHLGNGEFFLHALDDRRVLTSAESYLFAMVDPVDRSISRSFRPDHVPPGAAATWHFDVSPEAHEVAVLGFGSVSSPGNRLYLLDSGSLSEKRTFPLPRIQGVQAVAYHPSGDRLYVLGGDSGSTALRLLVLERQSGRILGEHVLPRRGSCIGLCNSSLMSVTRDGRFVILLANREAYFIDTRLDLPRFRVSLGFGVAASPVEDAVFFLDTDGALLKVTAPAVQD